MPAFRSVSVLGAADQGSGFLAPPVVIGPPLPKTAAPASGGWGTAAANFFQTGVTLLTLDQQRQIAKQQAKTAAAQARAAQAAAGYAPAQAGAFALPFGISPLMAVLGVVVVGGIAWAATRASK